jgi:hypothetical protein
MIMLAQRKNANVAQIEDIQPSQAVIVPGWKTGPGH